MKPILRFRLRRIVARHMDELSDEQLAACEIVLGDDTVADAVLAEIGSQHGGTLLETLAEILKSIDWASVISAILKIVLKV